MLDEVNEALEEALAWQEYFVGGDVDEGAVGFSFEEWLGWGEGCGLEVLPLRVRTMTECFALRLAVVAGPGGVSVGCRYDRARFARAAVERLGAQFAAVVADAVGHPGRAVEDILSCRRARERHQVVVGWNDTGRLVGFEGCVHQVLAARAVVQPGAVAVVDGERRLSFRELGSQGERGGASAGGVGAGPERRVGVLLGRAETVVGGGWGC